MTHLQLIITTPANLTVHLLQLIDRVTVEGAIPPIRHKGGRVKILYTPAAYTPT
jgi:hypothetical protein